ncbi:Rieske (2Fe-2S) protein [Nitrincola tapanii]|uniref:Rieske (2Fe-2S) protein n=1 Tax=Nitrincola tapanii TaxID=1708751 RepID=A0A5A9W0L6_9GAMM|nr:Rieske (2Fe-2S) protein [Nitrincola tapanii]KAA0873658.1 Rieske (2Fe-2S) protein [Nitrincola tapanii]
MQKICLLQDLPDQQVRGFDLEQAAILVYRQGETLRAFHNLCPHRGIRLEWQPQVFMDVEQQFIQCATHGALFQPLSGECIAGPCPGEFLQRLPIHLQGQEVWIEFNAAPKKPASAVTPLR